MVKMGIWDSFELQTHLLGCTQKVFSFTGHALLFAQITDSDSRAAHIVIILILLTCPSLLDIRLKYNWLKYAECTPFSVAQKSASSKYPDSMLFSKSKLSPYEHQLRFMKLKLNLIYSSS